MAGCTICACMRRNAWARVHIHVSHVVDIHVSHVVDRDI